MDDRHDAPPPSPTRHRRDHSDPAAAAPVASGLAATNVQHGGGSLVQRNQWIVLALASGACAAFNGVFAKLTTTQLTSSLSEAVAHALGLTGIANVVELAVRGIFFGLNLAFNAVMWTLFTKALTRGHSATQVSVINTSCNFVLTALLGAAIFSESLPALWWLGAALLVAGNVIIGQKDEGNDGVPKEDLDNSELEDRLDGPGHGEYADLDDLDEQGTMPAPALAPRTSSDAPQRTA